MATDLPSDLSVARALLAETRSAALATLDSAGAPFASYVQVAPGPDNSPVLLLSRLALHTRNLMRDPRASLLLVRQPPLAVRAAAAERLTLSGRVVGDDNPDARRMFLARHPEASGYADFGDFGFYRLEIEAGHLVAGFGRIATLSPAELNGRAPES
jgi:putative heme iron utilization protein